MCPDLRGGCGKYLLGQHKAAERRGLFPIMPEQNKDDEHVTCFRDAIMFSVYGKAIMDSLIDEHRHRCSSKIHDVTCKCYKLAEVEFLKKASQSHFWDDVYDETSEFNFEGKYLKVFFYSHHLCRY